MFLEPKTRQIEFQNNVFDERQVLQHADADIARVLGQCKPKIGASATPHTIIGKVMIDVSDKAHLPQILDTYAAALDAKNVELRNNDVPIHLSIKTDTQGVVYFVAGFYEPIEKMHMKFPYPIDLSNIAEPYYADTISHTDFAEREELLILVPQIYEMAKQGKINLSNVVIDKDEKGKLFVVQAQTTNERQPQYGSSMGPHPADLHSEEALEPAPASRIELSEQNLDAIKKAMKENYSDMLKEMKKYRITEEFPAKLEDCNQLQKLQILSWTIFILDDKWKNKLGQTYAKTKGGIKSPNEVFTTGLGDCDDYAILFHQSARQLGLLNSVSAYVATIDENKNSFAERKKNQKIHEGNYQFENEPAKHANLIMNIEARSHIFDLTHIPPFREFGETVDFGKLGNNKDLIAIELKIMNEGRDGWNLITSADYGFYQTPDSYFHYVAGASYFPIKNAETAEKAEKELLKSGLKTYDCLFRLAAAQMQQGQKKYGIATANFIAAAQMKPKDFTANASVAGALYKMGQYDQSAQFGEIAYKLNKTDLGNLSVLAYLYLNMKAEDYNRALVKGQIVGQFSDKENAARLGRATSFAKYARAGLEAAKGSKQAGDFAQLDAKATVFYSFELAMQDRIGEIDENKLRAAGASIFNYNRNSAFVDMEDYALEALKGKK